MAWDAADRLADRIAMGAQQAYVADLTAELMRMIADGVADPDRYAAVTRVSRDAAMGCLARHAPTVRGDVMAAFEEALAREDEALVRSLRHARAARAPHGFGLTATAENTVRQAADALAGVIRRQNTALADTMADAFNEAVGEAITRRAMGESVDAAVARAVRQLAARGLTTVDYKSGARTSIDACVRRHVVTQRNRCRNDLLMRRCDEWGQDLVMVSSHYGCRPSHEWFQGQVFSRSGKSGETSASNRPKVSYRPLSDTGYPSDPGGLCGCNCKHSMTPFVPGFSQLPDTEFAEEAASHGGMTSREYYEATQRQRELERRIRSCKREIAWGEAMGKDVAEQRYRLGSLQKAQREHCERNHHKRQPQREKAYAVPDPRGGTAPIRIASQPRALTAAPAGATPIEHGRRVFPKMKVGDDMAQALALVNREYEADKKAGRRGYTENCQRCVVTYEMRRRGYDVVAKPIVEELEDDFIALNWWRSFKGGRLMICGTGSGIAEAKSLLREWGDGARAGISIQWPDNGTGHVFVCENVDGNVVFIDPQSGEIGVDRYFDKAMNGRTLIMRIDTLEPSAQIDECCTSRSKRRGRRWSP